MEIITGIFPSNDEPGLSLNVRSSISSTLKAAKSVWALSKRAFVPFDLMAP